MFIRTFYDSQTKNDTIFAPSTAIDPTKGSPLAVIRISGPRTALVIDHLTSRVNPNKDSRNKRILFEPRKATVTKFFSQDTNELIDIGLVLWFPGPHSYTGEDVAEFHLHGSRAIVTKTLNILGRLPKTRPAEPGEFTRRAVENGKMSILQAESLPELIASQTDQQRQLAMRGLSGATRKKYEHWIEQLTGILAHLEASIDFGEDELLGEEKVVNECLLKIRKLSQALEDFIKVTSRCRDLVRAGAKATILGPPNAGKSTFMNLLCRSEKSIVSDLSGTTRDVVEHSFELGGHIVTICDTAGLREFSQKSYLHNETDLSREVLEKHDLIERAGIRKAYASAQSADLILYLVDGGGLSSVDWKRDLDLLAEEVAKNLKSLKELEGDNKALRENNGKRVRIVVNKIDKIGGEIKNRRKCVRDYLISALELNSSAITSVDFISCKTGENVDDLLKDLQQEFDVILAPGKKDDQFDFVNERHASLLISTQRHLHLASGLSLVRIDEMAQHVRESVDYLSRIVGRVTNDQVLDIVFRDFCIGK